MSIKSKAKEIISWIAEIYYEFSWKISTNRTKGMCLNSTLRSEKIVVSLTSFPGRIHIVGKTIQTILNQKEIKPDYVELWLAEEQFPNKEKDLPQHLLSLVDYGLTIRWTVDLRSYKKLIPAYIEHTDAIIVTADDDVYYRRNWLQILVSEYRKHPADIQCHKVTKFIETDTGVDAIGGGKDYYHKPSYLNKLVGVGGVLYPVDSLDAEVIKSDVFMHLAPTNDDIWFWLMAVKKGTLIHAVNPNYPKPIDVFGSNETAKLTSINDQGEMLFWKQYKALLAYYPEIKSKLEEEFKKVRVGELT